MARTADGDLRREAERRGRQGETRATWYLRLKGYRILARRYRTAAGEIDIVARRGSTVCFVEVKHRPSEAEAMTAVSLVARRRIARAAALWLAAHPAAAGLDQRFDVILVMPRRLPRHLVSIFDATGAPW